MIKGFYHGLWLGSGFASIAISATSFGAACLLGAFDDSNNDVNNNNHYYFARHALAGASLFSAGCFATAAKCIPSDAHHAYKTTLNFAAAGLTALWAYESQIVTSLISNDELVKPFCEYLGMGACQSDEF